MLLAKSQVEEDLKQLKKTLVDKHPKPFLFISEKTFDDKISEIQKTTNDSQKLGIIVKRLLAKIRDSHTCINYSSEIFGIDSYPLKVKYIKDGYYIVGTSKKHKELLGGKLLSINDIGISNVENTLKPFVSQENVTSLKYYTPSIMVDPVFLNFSKITKNRSMKVNVDVKGRKTEHIVLIEDGDIELMEVPENGELEETLKYKDKYWDMIYPRNNLFFFKYNECSENKDYPIKNVIQNYKKSSMDIFVIDLRRNKGGDSYVVKDLIDYLTNSQSQIFVLTGKDTYSSGIVNLMEFSSIPRTTTVGEIPHGTPTHFGETYKFELKNSKIRVQTSTKLFEFEGYKLGDVFKPNFIIEDNIEDLKKGVDTQMRFVFKKIS